MEAARAPAHPQQGEDTRDDHDSAEEGEEHPQVLEGEHAVQLGVVAEPDTGHGEAESQPGEEIGRQDSTPGPHQIAFHGG
ncbi:hypothetical protein [Streptomyces soliscabiei]|uniref:hypothetical protein n=1 Tax=Streptomyces soliscabiei TaxID=588897 RepID=UPI0029B07755|nr:hypothetical protein [Streptomyces sp. NY05-11A]MDX2678554.1 hypothetical protein [Streptomyces sp. NY05-11A]